jgi:protein-tyrosine phosphatase
MVRVLFVCLGNICRSPLAQGVFEGAARREGLENEIFVDSAGTGSWHVGSPPDQRALSAASLRGLDISAQRARRISRDDCENFDYILTMDEENYQMVSSLCRGSAVIRPSLDFATGSPERELPYQHYGSPGWLRARTGSLQEASEGLLEDVRGRHLNDRG